MSSSASLMFVENKLIIANSIIEKKFSLKTMTSIPDKYIFFLIKAILLLIILPGCREIYEPETQTRDRLLVIEGLITDQPGPHLVKLSYSSDFGESFRRETIGGATVTIQSEDGEIIQLQEDQKGYYYTPETFTAESNKTYKLNIITAEGKEYESRDQILTPSINPVEYTISADTRIFFERSNVSNTITQVDVEGFNLLANINHPDFNPLIRVHSVMLADYIVITGLTSYDHCWIIKSLRDYLEQNIFENAAPNIAQNRPVAFIPSFANDMKYIGFPNYNGSGGTSYGGKRIVFNYIYSINNETYDYYDQINTQLSDEGRFFDPVEAQLPGNIRNVNEPEEPVLGFFEVSSVRYNCISINVGLETAQIVNLSDTLAWSGCVTNTTPDFLQNLNKSNYKPR